MNFKPELVKKIKDYFGLNIYETKVWLALISKGVASAGEIAELSGVPRSRTYDVLETLEKEGFAIAKVGKPSKYIAVKPTEVIEKMKHNVTNNAEEKVNVLDNLKSTKEYAELEALHKTSLQQVKPEEISGSIKGRNNILGHAREIIENAANEVIILMPAHEFNEKARIFSGMFDRLKKANISIKVAVKGSSDDAKRISEKFGIKAVKTEINSKFFVIDKKQVLFYLTSGREEDEIAVWLNSELFSGSLAALFDMCVK